MKESRIRESLTMETSFLIWSPLYLDMDLFNIYNQVVFLIIEVFFFGKYIVVCHFGKYRQTTYFTSKARGMNFSLNPHFPFIK